MSSIIAFCVACVLIGVAFVAGVNWERGRPPTPAEMQEQLARHVEPQRTQETEPLLAAWIEGVDLDVLGKEG